jgi:RNA recognition motif-containing protein
MDIFVGSIPFKFKEEDLIAIFSEHGEVKSAKIVIDKSTRQNKGFGFVEMPNNNQALKAIKALNGSDQAGRAIVVSEAQKNKDGERIQPRDWHKPKKKDTKKDIISWAKGK